VTGCGSLVKRGGELKRCGRPVAAPDNLGPHWLCTEHAARLAHLRRDARQPGPPAARRPIPRQNECTWRGCARPATPGDIHCREHAEQAARDRDARRLAAMMRTCERCGAEFSPAADHQRFCSNPCAQAASRERWRARHEKRCALHGCEAIISRGATWCRRHARPRQRERARAKAAAA
jgi:hypothetical protein